MASALSGGHGRQAKTAVRHYIEVRKRMSSASTPERLQAKCKCGKTLQVPAKFAGKSVQCPGCGEPVTVPKPKQSRDRTPLVIHCGCGHELTLEREYAGRRVKCPNCRAPIDVPEEKPQDDQDVWGIADLLDEAGLTGSKSGRRCPSCRNDLPPEAVLCVNCGLNLETGKKLKTRIRKPREE